MGDLYTAQAFNQIREICENKLLYGHDHLLRLFMIAYLTRGHVLVEGPPGTGKTMTAKSMAAILASSFKRIQFTTDMLPNDLLGAQLFNPSTQQFDFIPGPVFADFVIADEVNRTPPRTQSALLEAMEERTVTVEGRTMSLPENFFVIATQNPHDFEGTYPLPESQLDRFVFKIVVSHGSVDHDGSVIRAVLNGELPPKFDQLPKVILDRERINTEISSTTIDRSIIEYIARILEATRQSPLLHSGSSVRGGLALARGSRVAALLNNRSFVIPDDVKSLVLHTLRHRIRLTPDAQIGEISEEKVLSDIVAAIPFPS